ncbi:MAG: sugar transferase [Pseudomonadota bacterium]
MTAASYVARLLGSDRAPAKTQVIGQHVLLRLNQLGALTLLVLFSPVLVGIAYMIWRLDGAPIFFGHYRVGANGKLFRCLKFRSMFVNAEPMLRDLLRNNPKARAEWDRDQKLSDDPRITPVGRFLRRTSLDELPQLFNVLRGEMALVGPRPVTVPELSRYGAARWHYLSVMPGMTGLWQVSGRNNTSYEERVELDKQYVESRNVWLDLSILARTAKVVVLREGAC